MNIAKVSKSFSSMLGALEIVVIEFVALSVICGILLKYYRSSSVPVDVVVSVYASWVLGFATVLILPYDVGISRNL